jgi:Ran GTPase-activating protein (RanGAP) involved in mRNA processing and transport
LVLNQNALFDAGATALADTLASNTTLTSLEVWLTIDPVVIAWHPPEMTLYLTSHVLLLQLRDNSIGEDGMLALTDAMQSNKVLVDLNVKLNQPGLRGEIALYKLLKVGIGSLSVHRRTHPHSCVIGRC